MPIYDKAIVVDRRILYIILAIAIAFPMFSPLGLPVERDELAAQVYNSISALPAGTPIIYSADFSSSGKAELKPMVDVLIDLSFTQGHRVILMSLWPEGAAYLQAWVEPIVARHKVVYGDDYINLGYMQSYSLFFHVSRTDFREACNGGIDVRGERLNEYPMMNNVSLPSDIKAVVSFGTGDPGYTHWVQHWYATGLCDAVFAGLVTNNFPHSLSAYSAGSLKGVINGSAGAATLEKEHGVIGEGYGASDSQALGHFALILFVILGNVEYVYFRRLDNLERFGD